MWQNSTRFPFPIIREFRLRAADTTPGILRHLGAILYDLLLMLALLMVATTLVVVPLSLQGAEVAIGDSPLFRLYLLAVGGGYYFWFWTHGGQTVGMKTWKFRLADDSGRDTQPLQALLRLLLAMVTNAFFLAGLLWRLFDSENKTLYDRLSHTRLTSETGAQR
jgi:uncharacterized RDD family membrane protein YckC